MELWKRIRTARQLAGLTQSELARVFDISRGAVALWERADPDGRTMPEIDKIPVIADVCGVDLKWLLTGEGSPREIPGVNSEILGMIPDDEDLPDEYVKGMVWSLMRALEERALKEDDAGIIKQIIDAARRRHKGTDEGQSRATG